MKGYFIIKSLVLAVRHRITCPSKNPSSRSSSFVVRSSGIGDSNRCSSFSSCATKTTVGVGDGAETIGAADERLTMGISSQKSRMKKGCGEAEGRMGATGRVLKVCIHGASPWSAVGEKERK